jgi:acyl-CoA synthetase (AMP-forming)/AMP-acid ligase II
MSSTARADEPSSHITEPPSVMAEMLARAVDAARGVRPLGLYERLESMASLFAATSPSLTQPIGLLKAAPALRRWGSNPAGIVVAGALQHPRRRAIVDDDEIITFAELEHRTNALARRMSDMGIGTESTVGILSHNRAMVIDAGMAASKVGASVVYLNSGFSAPQVSEVVTREGVDLLIVDEDAGELLAGASLGLVLNHRDVRQTIESGDGSPRNPPSSLGRIIVLTSGTTGTPKGAQRSSGGSPLDAAGILSCIPFVSGDTTVVSAPLFHGLGLFNANLALALGSTLILHSRFKAEDALDTIERHRAVVYVAVPAMLQRIVSLPRLKLESYDCSSLRIVVSGGAALAPKLSTAFMDRFGDVLYNVYGSTETALATIAGPGQLRRAPGTAGTATPGTVVRILDGQGHRVAADVSGRVFVGSRLGFDGYTGGGSKDKIGGLMSSGDLGHMDRWGRLFLEGREDEMIVSGGENVFPLEVETALAQHPGVLEAAVIGVADEAFGQRLKAFVVRNPGTEVDETALQAYVHDRLARFKVPREIVFVDTLPRNATGKVVKRMLA